MDSIQNSKLRELRPLIITGFGNIKFKLIFIFIISYTNALDYNCSSNKWKLFS